MFDSKREVSGAMFGGRRQGFGLIPLIQLLSLVLIFSLPAMWGAKIFTSTPPRYDRVLVRPGDTVWTLVARRTNASADLGEAVYQACQINHLRSGSRLQPGAVILLPKRL